MGGCVAKPESENSEFVCPDDTDKEAVYEAMSSFFSIASEKKSRPGGKRLKESDFSKSPAAEHSPGGRVR
jgi:hypothetical protein